MHKMSWLISLVFLFLDVSHAVVMHTDIIVVGAGPAGLGFCVQAEKENLHFILLDRGEGVSDLSKATGLHPATLKRLKDFGVLEEVLLESTVLTGLIQTADGVEVRRVDFRNGEQLEEKNVSCSQSVLESALRKKIDSNCFLKGVDFQRFEQDGKNVRVFAMGKDGEHYEIVGRVLIGADGAKSHVREQLKISFDGETTVALSVSFDVNYVGGAPLSSNIFYLLSQGPKRLVLSPIRSVPPRFKASGTLVSLLEGFDDTENKRMDEELVLPRLLESIQHSFNLYFDPESVSGVTFYRTQSRMADSFENFPVLLIGDAAHAFWPAGGYGLNLAIKEGVQLACTIAKHQILGDEAFKAAVCQFAAERREKSVIIQADTQLKKEKYADNSKANQAEREDQVDLE